MADDIEGLDRLLKRIGKLATDVTHVERPLKAAGALVQASVQKNFNEQGRPEKWTPLHPRTLARRRKGKGKGGSKILIDSARLRNSIQFQLITGPAVEVGTNVEYAARHHFGFSAGFYKQTKARMSDKRDKKGRRIGRRGLGRTPARPFLLLQGEDIRDIGDLFKRHISKK